MCTPEAPLRPAAPAAAARCRSLAAASAAPALLRCCCCLALLLAGGGRHGQPAAAAWGHGVRGAAAEAGGPGSRRLASIQATLPSSDIKLEITVDGASSEALPSSSVALAAGEAVEALAVKLTGSDTFDVSAATLKLVFSTVTDASAGTGACTAEATSLGEGHVSGNLAADGGAATTLSAGDTKLHAVIGGSGSFVFKMGGSFGLCYSDTGTFESGHADILDSITIEVDGVYDTCTELDCLTKKAYYCHALKGAQNVLGSCALTYDGYAGNVGSVTWSAAWNATWDAATGAQDTLTEEACGSAADVTVMCPEDAAVGCVNGSDVFIAPDAGSGNKVVVLPRLVPLASITRGYAVAACYCPDVGGCDDASEFIQQIGVIYVFTGKVCDAFNTAACYSSAGYVGVAAAREFTVMVHCPPGGCPADDGGRIKLVDASPDNDLAWWDASHGCGVQSQTAAQAAPSNCDSATSCSLSGGSRQDWKLFGNGTAFVLDTSASNYEARNFHSTQFADLCFCVGTCGVATNWFKVANIAHSPYRLLQLPGDQLSVINVPGSFGFYRSAEDLDSLGLTANSHVKLVLDPSSNFTDSECGAASFDAALVGGGTQEQFETRHAGQPVSGDDSQLVFNSADSANKITIAQAGIVAVCHCQLASCPEISAAWVFAARFTVRGPVAGQSWSVSTGLTFRLSYLGQGLTAGDKLRIVPATSTCTTNNGDPDADNSVQIGCPHACHAVEPASGQNMTLVTHLLDHSSVRCDYANQNCESVYIRKMTVRSATTTEIEFDADPGLSTGDHIILGSGIECLQDCSDEQLAAVKGVHAYGNSGTYNVGIQVTATSDVNRFLLPVGWTGTVPQFDVVSHQGQWSRISAAATAEELKGTEAKMGLLVCWSSGDGVFVGQAGTLAISSPPTMVMRVSLATPQQDQIAPIVISFSTGNHGAYVAAENSMLLKVVFLQPILLEPYLVDEDPIEASDDPVEPLHLLSNQAGCGRLFRELWSSDPAAGFPAPQGCAQRQEADSLELYMFFEPHNGLRAGQDYQVVMMAKARGPTAADVVQIISMDDIVAHPYEAVEQAQASMNRAVVQKSSGTSPRFMAVDGLTVLGGSNSVLELGGSLNFQVQVAGDSVGKIVRQTYLRLFMFPLTMWDLQFPAGSTPCSASCTPYEKTRCVGLVECSVEAVADAAQNNVIRLVLPADMDDITGETKHIFHVSSLTLPSGGFFPTRIGAQIGLQDGTQPDYRLSSGSYLWKQPDAGAMVAELVTRERDGNSRPFRGDTGNVLYAHLVLAATLYAESLEATAAFSVTLPPGYVAIDAGPVPAGVAVLDAAGVDPALGRGSLAAARWSCAASVCTYTLGVHDALHAGTHFFARFMANNPVAALQRNDASNQWLIGMTGTGHHTAAVAVPATPFAAVSRPGTSDFGANVAVLGKLSNHCAQPTEFSSSPADGQNVTNDVFIFFQTEQSAGSGGAVIVEAPALFDFGEHCSCNDLDDAYYAKSAGVRTWLLPQILACNATQADPDNGSARNQAVIRVGGILHPGRVYGFRIRVMNPEMYVPLQHQGWSLRTRTHLHQYVDGTDTSIAFVPAPTSGSLSEAQESWGMYQMQMNSSAPEVQTLFQISSLLPFSLVGQEATITVYPLQVEADLDTTLRIVAPLGFEWQFSQQDFVYRSNSTTSVSALVVRGATADLPGGVPTKAGNILRWPIASYIATERYGFITRIRVPDHSPTRSSNAFFVEFGYTDRAWGVQNRSAAARVVAPAVRALANARVDYSTNLAGKVNRLRFRVETVTSIPTRGGILIRGPAGFVFPDSCHPEPVSGGEHRPLPHGISCSFQAADSGEAQLHVMVGGSSLASGLYEFELAGFNPTQASANRDGEATACGWTHCWTFHSMKDMKLALASPELDARIATPGFAIKGRMSYAGLVALDDAARSATGRNDKPLQENRLTFRFQLLQDVSESGTLSLRGPLGFQFAEDCLFDGGVITDMGTAFADVAQLLEKHGTWEDGVSVSACRGEGSNAHIEVGAGLRRLKPYLFSIRVLSNPVHTPDRNKWTIESSSESSVPFDGFSLWTFTEASISPLVTAAMPGDVQQAAETPNFVNITFRPHSPVNIAGMLMLTAPSGFTFVSGGVACPRLLEERDPIQEALSHGQAEAYAFTSADVTCAASPAENILLLQFGSRPLKAGHDYELVAVLTNPVNATPDGSGAPQWKLQTFEDSTLSTSLDTVSITGFVVNAALKTWEYQETATFTAVGDSELEGLKLRLLFGEEVNRLDTITITAPVGYDLSDPQNRAGEHYCNQLEWGPAEASVITSDLEATCAGNQMTIVANGLSSIPQESLLEIQVSTVNPTITPSWIANYWHVEHRGSSGALISSGFFPGWRIIPQLQSVQVQLLGETMAGARGVIDISFVPVTPAVSVRIEATSPAGFDFSQCQLTRPGQVLLEALDATIRLTVTLVGQEATVIRMENIMLAPTGGGTQVNIATYDSSDALADQKLGFTGGFRLPGSIEVSEPRLETEYLKLPANYPIKSSWLPQLGASAVASFKLTFSNPVDRQMMYIVGQPYNLVRQGFQILDVQTNQVVPAVVTIAGGGALQARLEGLIHADRLYSLSVGVVAPLELPASQPVWRIQTDDGGELPAARNTAIETGFRLVSGFALKVETARSPPVAEIEVSISAALGATPVTELIVIAPPGFVFGENCLVSGSMVTSCEPGPVIAERSTARLLTAAGGASGTVAGLKVKLRTPPSTPPSRAWFLEGVDADTGEQIGWGEDASGFDVMQMRDTSVIYPGIPSIESQFAVRFRTSETIGRGGRIDIAKPKGFEMSCDRSKLWVLSLPGVVQCIVTDTSLVMTLNGTLSPGEHAFVLTTQTPAATPAENVFSVSLRDAGGAVRDAAMSISGEQMQTSLAFDGASLSWTSSDAGQASSITIRFSVQQPVARNVLGSLLITFPQNFEHAIEKESSVVSTNSDLPLLEADADSSWVDISMVDRLSVKLDSSKEVPVGDYSLEFPVTVPEYMPAYNIWLLTFCGPGTCQQYFSAQGLATFPLAGFELGQAAPGAEAGGGPPSAAAPRSPLAVPVVSLAWLLIALGAVN